MSTQLLLSIDINLWIYVHWLAFIPQTFPRTKKLFNHRSCLTMFLCLVRYFVLFMSLKLNSTCCKVVSLTTAWTASELNAVLIIWVTDVDVCCKPAKKTLFSLLPNQRMGFFLHQAELFMGTFHRVLFIVLPEMEISSFSSPFCWVINNSSCSEGVHRCMSIRRAFNKKFLSKQTVT